MEPLTEVKPGLCECAEPVWRWDYNLCSNCSRELPTAEEKLAAALKQIEQLQADIENAVWNLAGCDTIALGLCEPFDYENSSARPALHSVSLLRKERDTLKQQLAEAAEALKQIEESQSCEFEDVPLRCPAHAKCVNCIARAALAKLGEKKP